MVSVAPKLYSLAAVVILALASRCAAQELQIIGLKGIYGANSPIPFTIVKHVPGPVTFAVSAELLWKGKVYLERWDIFGKSLKMAVRREITLKQKTMELKWDVPHLMSAIRPEVGKTYRLRVDVLTPEKKQIYSEPFSISSPTI